MMFHKLQSAPLLLSTYHNPIIRASSVRIIFQHAIRPLSHSVQSSRPSIGHNFFLRNAPLITDSFEDANNAKKFIISCQPASDGEKSPSSSSQTADPAVKNSGISEVNAQLATPQTSASASSHIPFKISPKAVAGKASTTSLKKQINAYIALTKPNLTILVMLSSICSYALSPYPATVSQLLFLTVGTSLCSGAANAINMGREPEFDKRMTRTSTRPVVRGLVTPTQAYQFAALTGSVGVCTLYAGVNPLVASLGFLNIVLYSWIYTSLKRKSILNTWIGAIVGAIPPLMGWAAASGTLDHPAAWCLAGLLYAWQFPHFNALSHNIREQYKFAGYVMTAFENPRLNARVALRYALLMFPLCFGLSYFGVTDWYFQADSFALNAWLSYLSFQFWNQQRKNYSRNNMLLVRPNSEGMKLASVYAKKMFWGSVWHLPGVLILALLHKKGMWDIFQNR